MNKILNLSVCVVLASRPMPFRNQGNQGLLKTKTSNRSWKRKETEKKAPWIIESHVFSFPTSTKNENTKPRSRHGEHIDISIFGRGSRGTASQPVDQNGDPKKGGCHRFWCRKNAWKVVTVMYYVLKSLLFMCLFSIFNISLFHTGCWHCPIVTHCP